MYTRGCLYEPIFRPYIPASKTDKNKYIIADMHEKKSSQKFSLFNIEEIFV
jgi:hypothetical protein